MKLAISGPSIIAGYMLAWSGYLENVTPSAEVTQRMKFLMIAVQYAGLGMADLPGWT